MFHLNHQHAKKKVKHHPNDQEETSVLDHDMYEKQLTHSARSWFLIARGKVMGEEAMGITGA